MQLVIVKVTFFECKESIDNNFIQQVRILWRNILKLIKDVFIF